MTLNLIKLCVGAESLDDLLSWGERRLSEMAAADKEVQLFHTTRMMPRQAEQLLEGGSLYWVIKGNVQARQRLVDIRPFTDDAGIKRCHLMLDNQIIATQWQPRRAFQGWRYLKGEGIPADLSTTDEDLPPPLRAKLAELGLL